MLRIQKLKKPTRKSGHPLAPNGSTKVKGVVITNTNTFPIYVDRWIRNDYKKSRKKK